MRIIIFSALIILGIFIFLDNPVGTVKSLLNTDESRDLTVAEDEFRQGVRGMKLFLDNETEREGRRVAAILDDWLYCYPPTGEVILVPRGYQTDFASIPGWAQFAISPFGRHAEAAVAHDWLYAVGEEGKRQWADELFRYAMMEKGVNAVKRNSMFRAVRAGGDKAYGREDEWRFVDTDTLEPTEPPLERPVKAAVTRIDCVDLEEKANGILAQYGSDAQLFNIPPKP
ncbi:MAG: DUF1353 domain-containing protein [Aquisalinus sp.]|nr:DUF1353 domain-containing protein [Aquisalinus sp.]